MTTLRDLTTGDNVTGRHDADDPLPWGPAETRTLLDRVRNEGPIWDIAVVGAGIAGAGIAREAARQGFSVLVIEAVDVAYGTSSRSTRLIHGGVRYLEHGELGLVLEALRERAWLTHAAPHLVRPERFLFPSYRGDRHRPWSLRVGLSLYDALNRFRSPGHRAQRPDECRATEPLLAAEGLRGGVLYEDAVTDDARLTLAVLQDARRHGADVLTDAPVRRIDARDGEHRLLLAGNLEVRARQAVVAAGPWSGPDLLGPVGETLLTHSKGIHVVVRAEDVPLRQPLVVQVPRERRILFGVPWGPRTYLGTTDDPFEGDLHNVGVTAEEEHAVLRQFQRVLPHATLAPDRIVSAWAGVRPLVRPVRARSTHAVSRHHRIIRRGDGVLCLVGGKLTTFRAMARDLLSHVHVEPSRRSQHPSAPIGGPSRPRSIALDDDAPLLGGPPLTPEELRDPIVAALAPRHGPMARVLARQPDAAVPLVPDLPYRRCEIDYAIRFEGVTHLSDLLRRRIPLVLTDVALGATVAREVATQLVDARGGSGAEIEEELERYADETERETRRRPRWT